MSGASSERFSKRAPKKGSTKAEPAPWQGFVDIPLSQAQKDACKEDNWEPEMYMEFLERVVADGYKVGWVSDATNHCVIVSLTGKEVGSVNEGFTLVARGADVKGSLRVLEVKHIGICDELHWANFARETSEEHKWG